MAQISVSLSPSQTSPIPLGNVITWTASASGPNLGTPTYRFRVRPVGQNFRTVVDYGPNSTLNWTTIDQEGSYEVEVSVRSGDGTQQASTSAIIALAPLATGSTPVITPTANPLVFIYSASACSPGQSLSVQFTSPEGITQSTPSKACNGFTMNFYLAGMRALTQYTIQHRTGDGAVGPVLTLQTSSNPLQPYPVSVLAGSSQTDAIILQSPFALPATASDLEGNIVWYYAGNISFLTRPVKGGSFMGVGEDGTKDSSQQFIREFDVAGVTLAETNAARVDEQLAPMGVHPINGFHHDARKLPNGNYLAIADSERILTDVQGPGPVDVVGDTILVLDPNLQVLWAWDSSITWIRIARRFWGKLASTPPVTPAAPFICPRSPMTGCMGIPYN